jgi:hypothetical protein
MMLALLATSLATPHTVSARQGGVCGLNLNASIHDILRPQSWSNGVRVRFCPTSRSNGRMTASTGQR